MVLLSAFFRLRDRPKGRDLLLQVRQLTLENLPDDVEVNAEVVVNDPVAQAYDPVPRDLRMPSLEIPGQPIGRLADDLQVSNYGIYRLLVMQECILIETAHIPLYLLHRLPDVLDE